MPFKPMNHTDGRAIPFTQQQMWDKCGELGIQPSRPQQACPKQYLWNRLHFHKVDGKSAAETWLDTVVPQVPQPVEQKEEMQVFPLTKEQMINFARKHGVSLGDYDRKTVAQVWDCIVGAGLEDQAREDGAADKVAKVAATAPATGDLASTLRTLLGVNTVDADMVRRVVAEELAKQSPVVQTVIVRDKVEVKLPDGEYIREEVTDVVDLLSQGMHVMLVGPAGSGKSHFAEQVAKVLGLSFAGNSCSAGMSESILSGWLLPIGEAGKFVYVSSLFVKAYEEGGVYLLDEIDAADPNLLVFINQALANGHFFLPQRHEAPRVNRHDSFRCIAAANTYGTGGDRIYVGREQLDAATLDRFWMVAFGYDKRLEEQAILPEVREWMATLRDLVAQHKIRRPVSTRKGIQASQMIKGAGWKLEKVKRYFFEGWSVDERAKVGFKS